MAAVEEQAHVEKKIHEENIHNLVFSKPGMSKGGNVFENDYMGYEFYSLIENFKGGYWDNNIAYVVSGSRIKLTHKVAQVLDIPDCYVVLSNEKEKKEDSTLKPLYCFKYDKENGYYEQIKLAPGNYTFAYLDKKHSFNSKTDFVVDNKKEEPSENLAPNSSFFNKADRNLSSSSSVWSSDIKQQQKDANAFQPDSEYTAPRVG